MSVILTGLALAGALAILTRLVRSGARLAFSAAEAAAASGLAEVSARRGDLTAMNERRLAERKARTQRRKGAFLVALWLAWLIVPLFLGWAEAAFALAAPLWLLPKPPLRSTHPVKSPQHDS